MNEPFETVPLTAFVHDGRTIFYPAADLEILGRVDFDGEINIALEWLHSDCVCHEGNITEH